MTRTRRRHWWRRRLVCRRAVELVTDYIESALTPRERARLEAHLAGRIPNRAFPHATGIDMPRLGPRSRVTPVAESGPCGVQRQLEGDPSAAVSARQVSRLRGFVTRLRWYEVGPELLLTAGLGLFAATEPHAAGSAFRSNKATVVMVTVALGWIAIRTATLAVVHWPVVRVALFTAAAIAILKVVVLPAYTDHTVIEAHPIQATASATSVPPPDSASADVQHAPALATRPVRERSGPFRGIDHRAVGTVNVYRQTDGHVVVGLENFDIQPGPAYALYLVPGTDRRDHDRGSRLGRLRGNKGTQFYDAPAALDVGGGPWTVLVWCETFDVPVANATPTSV